ncbi:MAG: hypothetical protein Q4D93_05700 [Porphyromonas sp.]|nr:hypothetical protein [Porphyromonas sp.]
MSDKEVYDELDIEDQELLDHIREATSDIDAINDLTDDDLQLLLDLWYDYLVELDDESDDEDVEVDTDDLYEYIQEALDEEDVDFDISLDHLLTILDAEQDFVEEYIELEDE